MVYTDSMQPVLIISDSLGDSAAAIVEAAATQFKLGNLVLERLPNAKAIGAIKVFVVSAQEKYSEQSLVAL